MLLNKDSDMTKRIPVGQSRYTMKLTKNSEGPFKIDGLEIGWVTKKYKCPTCNSSLIYYDDYDEYFCAQCNQWLHDGCGDPYCEYCSARPERPLPPVPNPIFLMNAHEKVEDFLKKTPADKRRIILKLRDIIKMAAGDIDVYVTWGDLFFEKNGKFICNISVNKSYVNLHFRHGAELGDPKKILLGKGKQLIHLRTGRDVDKEAITEFVKQSIGL